MKKVLRIAVQKSGRTTEKVLKTLVRANFDLPVVVQNEKLILPCANFPLEILFVRNFDIPSFVESGVADAGFVGENVLWEQGSTLQTICQTGFLKCALRLAVPKNSRKKKLSDFQGSKVATSFPNATRKFFKQHGVKDVEIVHFSGSVEIAPSIGMADSICDLVSTGSTLRKHNLVEFCEIFQSQVVIAAAKGKKSALLDEFIFRVQAILNANNTKLMVFDAPKKNLRKIVDFLPCAESPTISPLSNENWVSITTALSDTDFWQVVPKLKKLGAKAILGMPIEKLVL